MEIEKNRDERNKDNEITLSGLKDLGWTDKMIRTLLPEPRRVPNSLYRSAAPIKLWKIADIEAVKGTERYREAVEAAAKRKESAKKAIMTKEEKLRKEVDRYIRAIEVEVISNDDLYTYTLSFQQAWYYDHGKFDNDVYSADWDTVLRWEVNFVRHNLTDYEEVLWNMSGKVGVSTEYHRYKIAVLDAIAQAYPHLKKECKSQKNPRMWTF